MTTLEEFRGTVKEFREKLNNPNNTPQKNQALLQYIKDFCAHTLELPQLDQQFEREVKDTLFATEQQLAPYKGTAPMTFSTSPAPTSPSKSPSSLPMKSPLKSDEYTSPSESTPISVMMDSIMPSVPVSGFDPNSSPILRRLKQGKSIQDSLIKSEKVPDLKSEAIPSENSIEKSTIPDSNIETGEVNASSDEASGPNVNKIFEAMPFPQEAAEEKKPELVTPVLKEAYLEIPKLNANIDLNKSPILWIGRQDFAIGIKRPLPADFLDPIIPKVEDGTDKKAHFILEQPSPGEFWLKDPGNNQKTYYKAKFIDSKGVKIADGDEFIIPVKINNQLSSLNILFHIKK